MESLLIARYHGREIGSDMLEMQKNSTSIAGETKMAKMHSRKRGLSGSTRPLNKVKPSWVTQSPKEIEMLIAKLAKEGKTASMIGLILRDSYGVPDVQVLCGKSISQIISDKGLAHQIPDDLRSLLRRALQIRKHLQENHKDMTANRGLQLTESKIGRLVKYYKKTEKLPWSWKYDPEQIKIYVE